MRKVLLLALIIILSNKVFSQTEVRFGYIFTAAFGKVYTCCSEEKRIGIHVIGFYGDFDLNKSVQLRSKITVLLFLGIFGELSVNYYTGKNIYLSSGFDFFLAPQDLPIFKGGIGFDKNKNYFVELFFGISPQRNWLGSMIGLNFGIKIKNWKLK